MRKRSAALGLIALALLGVVSSAQKSASPNVIAQLLALPAPRPTNPYQPKPISLLGYDEKHGPPEDAPIEELELYWRTGGPHPDKSQISAKVQQRFLAYGEQHQDKLPFLLDQGIMPDNSDTHARIKARLEMGLTNYSGEANAAQRKQYEANWKNKLHEWLLLHSNYFLEELAQKASAAKDENGEILAEQYLQALAKLDWPRAQPLLENYRYSPQLRTATLALRLLYEHSVATKSADADNLRVRLQQIVADQQAAGKARELACEALMKTTWEGREEWFLSLFADDTLRAMEDGKSGKSYPLNNPVLADPEHWVPLLAKLVGHSNPAIHDSAVDCLASFDPAAPHLDALRPLLPWLANPNWSRADGRKELIQSLAKVNLPEAVPGLIWIAEHDEDGELARYAAEALATYRSRNAAPALKRLLARPLGPSERTTVITALIACGGLSDDEMAQAVEMFAAKVASSRKSEMDEPLVNLKDVAFDDNVPLQINIGKVVSEMASPQEEVASKLLERIQTLEKSQPALARVLWALVQKWDLRVVDETLVQHIAANTADVRELEFALSIRQRLRQSVNGELQTLAVKDNSAAGLAAVMLEDDNLLRKILSGESQEAKRALLAAARLARVSLPLTLVGALLNDALLQLAAERYLTSEDSADARQLIWGRHQGEALILGAREHFGSNPKPEIFLKWEEKLRAEVLVPDGAEEIIALLAPRDYLNLKANTTSFAPNWQTQNHLVIRVRKGHAELAWHKDDVRHEYREIAAVELGELRDFLTEKNIENLPPLIIEPRLNRTEYEFLRLTKNGGRRVYITNPEKSIADENPYADLLRKFQSLTEDKEFKARYEIQKRIKGMEVLLTGGKHSLTTVCGDERKTAVFVRYLADGRPEADDMGAPAGRTGWYEITGGKLGGKVEMPKSCGLPELVATLPTPTGQVLTIVQSGLGDDFPSYLILTSPAPGTTRFPNILENEIFVSGNYEDVIATPDNKWLLIVQGKGRAPKSLVRIERLTKQEYPIKLAVTGTMRFFRFLPTENKFLLQRRAVNGQTETYLIDPTNGEFAAVRGDFRPLPFRTKRDLQPTRNLHEAWATVYNERTNATEIGRYHLKTFSFAPVASIPELRFDSSVMWIDEAASAIYVAYQEHLLRFPLQQ